MKQLSGGALQYAMLALQYAMPALQIGLPCQYAEASQGEWVGLRGFRRVWVGLHGFGRLNSDSG